jgi:hypothetical protein
MGLGSKPKESGFHTKRVNSVKKSHKGIEIDDHSKVLRTKDAGM